MAKAGGFLGTSKGSVAMTDLENGKLRAIAWTEVCPWLCLFRTFRVAIGFRMLLLAAVAILLTVLGWALVGWAFSGTCDTPLAEQIECAAAPTGCPWRNLVSIVPDQPTWPGHETIRPVEHVWKQFSMPFVRLFGGDVSLTAMAYWLVCGLWALAVWALFGAAITRTAAVRLAAEERIGWGPMLDHVKSRCGSYFLAPLLPMLGALLATLPILCIGLLLRSGVTLWIGAILWPVLLLGGLFMSVLLLGLLFGWPLMWATISVEGSDSFDALSRGYGYTFQRPLHYLFYAIVAGAVGVVGWILVSNFAAAVIHMTYWAASCGSGQDRVAAIMAGDESLGMIGGAGATVIRFWTDCVKLLAVGFLYSYFWTAATAVYLLLRRDVDAREMDEVNLGDQEGQKYGLPPVGTDALGAPVACDDAE